MHPGSPAFAALTPVQHFKGRKYTFCSDSELCSNVRYPLQIVNVTELQLPQVDVRVGLDGAVNFLDKSPQALRQLKDLASQVGYRDPFHPCLSGLTLSGLESDFFPSRLRFRLVVTCWRVLKKGFVFVCHSCFSSSLREPALISCAEELRTGRAMFGRLHSIRFVGFCIDLACGFCARSWRFKRTNADRRGEGFARLLPEAYTDPQSHIDACSD